ncbi:MAG: DUF1553 domain-containing protein [Pirellulales bacterium]
MTCRAGQTRRCQQEDPRRLLPADRARARRSPRARRNRPAASSRTPHSTDDGAAGTDRTTRDPRAVSCEIFSTWEFRSNRSSGALHPLPPDTAPANCLRLARWLVDPANPLTPRVTVNRAWQHLFGRGLVETEDDFGLQGTLPSHLLLLDWLACEFPDADRARTVRPIRAPVAWSIKRLLRTVVTSATYRQSSQRRPDLEERDPRNDWLGRQNRLARGRGRPRFVAGRRRPAHHEIGGPSVMPPQPEGVHAFTQDPKPCAETGANRYRRGLYTFFWRSPLSHADAFDAPNANVTCTRRIRSNTPLQALTLANDVAFVECAQAFARQIVLQDRLMKLAD